MKSMIEMIKDIEILIKKHREEIDERLDELETRIDNYNDYCVEVVNDSYINISAEIDEIKEKINN